MTTREIADAIDELIQARLETPMPGDTLASRYGKFLALRKKIADGLTEHSFQKADDDTIKGCVDQIVQADIKTPETKPPRWIETFLREHQIACEQLTEKQLAAVILDAMASGDLIRNVRVSDNAQSVIYIPYAESERLKSRIAYLESVLANIDSAWESRSAGKDQTPNGIKPDKGNWD